MKKIIVLMMFSGLFLIFNSCKKKADEPPVKHYLMARYYSVPELRTMATCTNSCKRRFAYDHYFAGVVIADHVSGNFYKEIYIRDRYNTGALRLDLLSSACNFFIGDSVRFNLKGYDIGINGQTGMLEIDSVDCEKALVKFSSGPAPQPITIDLGCDNYTDYLCDLVKINYAGFQPASANQIWANAVMQTSENRTIEDCDGNEIVVRTSNYASFAQEKTPTGYGSIVGIATAYGETNQMAIRHPGEVNMTGPPCNIYHIKDWNDNSLTSGGWTQQSVIDPSVLWTASTFGADKFAKISGFYSSTNHNSENWLISPAMNLSGSNNPVLTFKTAAKFSGNPLQVWVSTNYVSGAPASATWKKLYGFKLSPNTGNYVWTSSCPISLSAFKSSNTRIAFKYSSTTFASTTYELDNVIIREN